jgi:hypothetical protein
MITKELTPINSKVSVTDSTTSVDVSDANIVEVNDPQNCAIFGFSGGTANDIIYVYNKTTHTLILKDNSTGTQKIRNGSDITITGYGGAVLTFDGSYWFVNSYNP